MYMYMYIISVLQLLYMYDLYACIAMQSYLGHATNLSSKVQHFIWSFNVIYGW
jgi:hypothetical protein